MMALGASSSAPAQQTSQQQALSLILQYNSRPAIAILRETPRPDDGSARSWFGGVPRMPPALAWPTSTITKAPMFFIAQIDIGDLPKLADRQGLPETGVLWFFAAYDGVLEESDRVRVLYDPRSSVKWPKKQPPQDLPPIYNDVPYSLLPPDDPLARLDFHSAMRFVPTTSYFTRSELRGSAVDLTDYAVAARRKSWENLLGRPGRAVTFGSPHKLGSVPN
ncbi:MAG: DUF1963 domain-containing protein [Pseudomonadota bacterium]